MSSARLAPKGFAHEPALELGRTLVATVAQPLAGLTRLACVGAMPAAQRMRVADEPVAELASLRPSMADMVAIAAAPRGCFAAVENLARTARSTSTTRRSLAGDAPPLGSKLASLGQHLAKRFKRSSAGIAQLER